MTSTFYPPYHIGGDAVHVKYLADELTNLGHEVHVMHSIDAYNMKRTSLSEEGGEEMVVTHPLKSPFGKLTPYRIYTKGSSSLVREKFTSLVNNLSPDVVHHHNVSLLGHSIFKKKGDYVQLYTAHDYWLICQRNDLMKDGDLCQSPNCFSCAIKSKRPPQVWRKNMDIDDIDCIICPSEYMANQLHDVSDNIKTIHNFAPDPPKNIGNSGFQDYYLFLGVIESHKGIKELIDAFSQSNNKLIIGGEGSLDGWLIKKIDELSLSPRVQYNNLIRDKWPFLKDAKAVIIPSIWHENCPLVALEAISVGTPVFCSDIGGTKEIVEKISKDLIMPIEQLPQRLRNLEVPDISKESIIKVFQEKFSAKRYMDRYMSIAKGDWTCT